MRKKVGIVKRLFTLLLIFLLSINSFAAIVSDNDGSAFITKAEFDALKSSFQAQIDSYNQSIDTKIDGAIAQYLAGIQIAKVTNKTILIGEAHKTVGYFDDQTNIKYVYGDCGLKYQAYGLEHVGPQGTTRYQPNAKYTQINELSATHAATSGKEPVVKYDSTKTPNWIWDGYYGNVKWNITSNVMNLGALHGAFWSNMTNFKVKGPMLNHMLSALDYNWSNYNPIVLFETHWQSDVGGTGRYTDNSYFKSSTALGSANTTTTISVEYGAVTDSKYDGLKLDQYVIAYRCEPNVSVNMCTGYNNCRSSIVFGKYPTTGTATRFYTKTAQNYWNGTSINGGFVFTWLDVNEANIDNGNIRMSKETNLGAAGSATWWTATEYVPVVGGVGELTGNAIRQESDGLYDSEIGKRIQLNNLSLAAGLPVCIEKKDAKIKWPIKFVDKTKNYKVWLSYEPFNTKTDTASDYANPAYADKYVTITNNPATTDYITIVNGEGVIEWTMESESPVYCKWCCIDGGVDKGIGQIDLTNSSTYTRTLDS